MEPPRAATVFDADVAEALKSFVAQPVAERLLEAGGKLPEERRLVTALFADVSGFTTLSEKLDPEQLIEVIDPLISSLSRVVARYEGWVDKYAGDALLALFGAPVSHEDDAERALHVALEMHAELERLRAELPHGEVLGLHIGVNSGHAIARIHGSDVRMDYSVLGDAVNLAQRLESVAPSGETYVSETTHRLVGERFAFESVGELTLKGKSEPVPAWRLVGEQARVERARRKLIGRSAEVAQLSEVLEQLTGGHGSTVVVAGDPGVGKSRLTEELRVLAGERDVRWLETRCLSYGASLAYWPFSALLRAEPEVVELAGVEGRPFVEGMLGEATTAVDDLEPEAFRRGLHAAIAASLGRVAEERPALLVIEDVHWADPSSLALLAELTRALAGRGLAFVLLTRPEELAKLADTVPVGLTVELRPLDGAAVESMISELLGGSPPEGLASSVAERTGGNPLFVEEIVASLREAGALTRIEDRWSMSSDWDAVTLPTSIEKVLASRIDLLPRAAAATLQQASVIGRRIRVELLTAVAADVLGVEDAVRELLDRGFFDSAVDEDGAPVVLFHHGLIIDAAYGRLLRRARREMHLRVAEVAQQLYGAGDDSLDLLARHYYLAGAAEQAVPFLVRAGERDKQLFANDEAILNFSRALELEPGNLEVKLELADLHELVGAYDDALPLYEQLRDALADVRPWRGIASTLRKRGEYQRALEVIDEAFASEALRDLDLTPLWSEQGRTLELAGRVPDAIAVLEAGLEAASDRTATSVGQILYQLAHDRTVQGELDAALENALEAERIFAAASDLRGLASTMRALGGTYRLLGRLDEAAAALREGLEIAERVGNVEEIGGCLMNLGIVEATRGANDAALAAFRRAVQEFDRIDHGSGRPLAHANLAYMLTLCELYDEALDHCHRAIELAQAVGHTWSLALTYDTMASISLARGLPEEAVQRAEEAAALHLEMGALPDAVKALEIAIEASDQSGDFERARTLREQARSLAVAETAS